MEWMGWMPSPSSNDATNVLCFQTCPTTVDVVNPGAILNHPNDQQIFDCWSVLCRRAHTEKKISIRQFGDEKVGIRANSSDHIKPTSSPIEATMDLRRMVIGNEVCINISERILGTSMVSFKDMASGYKCSYQPETHGVNQFRNTSYAS
jgi:hypothetical protein